MERGRKSCTVIIIKKGITLSFSTPCTREHRMTLFDETIHKVRLLSAVCSRIEGILVADSVSKKARRENARNPFNYRSLYSSTTNEELKSSLHLRCLKVLFFVFKTKGLAATGNLLDFHKSTELNKCMKVQVDINEKNSTFLDSSDIRNPFCFRFKL